MKCPKCKTIDLQKRGFDSPSNCYQCGGMWLEKETLPNFFESSGKIDREVSGAAHNDDKTGLCPEGHGIMIRAKIEVEEPFFLEKCTKCGGIWFDNGEWLKIINNNLVDNINEFWCKSWQNKQRKEKSRANYLESNKRLLGDDVFEEIMKLAETLKDHPEKGRAVALLQQEIIKSIN